MDKKKLLSAAVTGLLTISSVILPVSTAVVYADAAAKDSASCGGAACGGKHDAKDKAVDADGDGVADEEAADDAAAAH